MLPSVEQAHCVARRKATSSKRSAQKRATGMPVRADFPQMAQVAQAHSYGFTRTHNGQHLSPGFCRLPS